LAARVAPGAFAVIDVLRPEARPRRAARTSPARRHRRRRATNAYDRLNVPARQVAGPGAELFEEDQMNWNKWVRQIHRWLAIIFTVTVIITFVALAQEEPVVWVSYVPLLPLALLLLTGLNLFMLPYVNKWRSGRRTARAN
jgi:hypothetical protein